MKRTLLFLLVIMFGISFVACVKEEINPIDEYEDTITDEEDDDKRTTGV